MYGGSAGPRCLVAPYLYTHSVTQQSLTALTFCVLCTCLFTCLCACLCVCPCVSCADATAQQLSSSGCLVLQEVIVASTLGVLLGWPVAGIAFTPFILYVLGSRHLLRSCATLFATVLPVLVLLVATDSYFYGRQTVRCPQRMLFVHAPCL